MFTAKIIVADFRTSLAGKMSVGNNSGYPAATTINT